MKKNISINISGIIFHIEEDGYETLRKYLDSIKRYFASFEDSSEILTDIEGRIAEIFLAKLNEGKQVITAEDVNSLIATMGSVNDFKIAEEQELGAAEIPSNEDKNRSQQGSPREASKRLFRDQKRKIAGGVCAGLAHYFNIDPVWPRLLFALLVLGSYGSLIIVYIIMWIAIPASAELVEEPTVKKMYRDREKKVIGGVASGVAAFFAIDIALVRVLFVIFGIFGGIGLLAYIILWIALPEAKTITEKMQMQGEPVTLSNIESTVKKNLNEKEGEESTLAKIVLFPFRLIAMIIDAISKVLGPVFRVAVDVMRMFIGLAITLTGVFMLIAIFICAGIIFGFVSMSALPTWWDVPAHEISFPMEALRNSFPTWTIICTFFVTVIPTMFIILVGSSIIAKKIIFNAMVGWSMFVIFFLSAGVLSFTIPQIVYSFKEEGEYRIEKTFPLNGKTAVLKINEVGLDDYDVTSLTIKGYEGTDLKLVQRFEAQGNTRKNAGENAQMTDYAVVQNDSSITFDSNITFKKGAKFRAQRLDMDLFIPYNTKFVIEEGVWRILKNNYRNRDYRDSNFGKTWIMTEDGFECINCLEPTTRKAIELRDQFGLNDFNSVDISGWLDVRIEQGDAYAVEMSGPESQKKRYKVFLDQETLVVEYNEKKEFFWKRNLFDEDKVKINITMPQLKEMNVKGAGKVIFNGFNENDIEIDLKGAVNAEGDINADNLTIDIDGASILELKGRGHFMEASLVGACGLRAYNYEVNQAIIEAQGASSAKVYVLHKLEMDEGVASSISYRGDPEVVKRN